MLPSVPLVITIVSGGAGRTKRSAIQNATSTSSTNGPTVSARSRQETREILKPEMRMRESIGLPLRQRQRRDVRHAGNGFQLLQQGLGVREFTGAPQELRSELRRRQRPRRRAEKVVVVTLERASVAQCDLHVARPARRCFRPCLAHDLAGEGVDLRIAQGALAEGERVV